MTSMDPRDILKSETAYIPAVQRLLRSNNTRLDASPKEGDTWVRVCPASMEELAQDLVHPFLVRFHRLGSLGTIVEIVDGCVHVQCGSEVAFTNIDEFIQSWIRTNDWSGTPQRISDRP